MIKDYANELLSWMGFLPENSKILFLGLDNAGKTTYFYIFVGPWS